MLDGFRSKLDLFRQKPLARYKVKIYPWNAELDVNSGENLLETVLQQGIVVPYNCRVGACKTCRIRVIDGHPKSLIEREYVFSQEEIRSGVYLACQTSIVSDMVIEWLHSEENASNPELYQNAQLLSIHKMTPRIHRIQIQLENDISWNAGQFAQLLPLFPGAVPRCYSMIEEGGGSRILSFDITRYLDGKVSSWITDNGNIGKLLRVKAPYGDFGNVCPVEESNQSGPMLYIAGGSGIGSIGGIIASHVKRNLKGKESNPVLLVIGARDSSEVYGLNSLQSLLAVADTPFHVCVVLDREPLESKWSGRRGYVGEHLKEILNEAGKSNIGFLKPYDLWQILLCGPPPLVETSIEALISSGMQAKQISFDKYEQFIP